MRLAAIPTALDARIRAAVRTYPCAPLDQLVADSLDTRRKHPLAIKYMPAKWAGKYQKPGARLKVSATAGFTWGTATYVAPTAFPVSTAIYGRVGVVAEFDPSGWQVFDATTPAGEQLYVDWIGFQPFYRMLTLTMHSSLANQFLRDLFRTMYQIDCVLFHPDQFNSIYTASSDVWMAVTDWTPAREIDNQDSGQFTNARMTVIVEEEFEPSAHDIVRNALIGPLSPRDPNSLIQSRIAAVYANQDLVRVLA